MNERRKRIFFMVDKLAPGKGGVSTHLLGLIANLKEDYLIDVCGLGGQSKGPVIDQLKEWGIPIHFLGVDKVYAPRAFVKFFQLVNLLKTLKPDIMHTYLFSSNIFGIPAGYWAAVPVRISSRREVGNWKRSLHVAAERWISRLCDTVLVPSNAIKEHAVKFEHVRERKFTVIHNGIDRNRFMGKDDERIKSLQEEFKITPDDVIIGTTANLIPVKDHDTLFAVADQITSAFPQTKFLIVGGGPLLEKFRQKAREWDKQERILYLGYRWDADDIIPLFDIYICTSLMEGFSNAVLEAMGAGKPVVATHVGGNPEAVVDGETGFLVPPRDAAAMAEKLMVLIKDADLRRRMGEKGRERVEREFTSEKMAREIEKLYQELLAAKLQKSSSPETL